MKILCVAGNHSFKHPDEHDPNEQVYYAFGWKPQAWANGIVYLLNDVVAPTTANGFYYLNIKPGLSGALEPSWSTAIRGETTDGTATWRAMAYDFLLKSGDTFTSTWSGDTGVTLDNPGSDGKTAWVRVTAVPSGAYQFTLTNTIVVTRADAKVETLERSMIVKVATL